MDNKITIAKLIIKYCKKQYGDANISDAEAILIAKQKDQSNEINLIDLESALLELCEILEAKHEEEIIEARIVERKRAKEIAYGFMEESKRNYQSKKSAGNDFAFIDEKISEECRYVGNAISGGNALSAALGETMEDRVRYAVRIDKLYQLTGIDKNIISRTVHELKNGSLKEQLNWLNLNIDAKDNK